MLAPNVLRALVHFNEALACIRLGYMDSKKLKHKLAFLFLLMRQRVSLQVQVVTCRRKHSVCLNQTTLIYLSELNVNLEERKAVSL